ncbi:Zn-ribbon domain-containing OB-fold protein [Rhodococcus sp. KRD162]|uniref:Zn-ribbon domain-containing OB-fold protein n=1 Tax=Rhodococcus sp. KRD162 TaxID=2729725 RepID=UPI0019D00BBA|nr:OB-fold domain-containing protein [Rhodococcus sp. KRD162]
MTEDVNEHRPIPRGDAFAAPYWDALREGQFVLPRLVTGEFISPTRAIPAAEVEWVPAPRSGTIASFSWVHIQPSPGYVEQLPYVLATVRLDAGPQLMCNIVATAPDDVAIGRRVELVTERRAEGWVVAQFTVV